MARINQRSIDELRARLNIVEVVERHVQLKRSGRQFRGLSPFNAEKTPSFYVEPAKNVYYCYSSNKGGDAIRFIMEVENLTFFEAVETLAERYGITLEYEDGGGPTREDRSLRHELVEIHEQAAQFYHDALFATGELPAAVREYWTQQRRFDLDVARTFRIGFSDHTKAADLMRLLMKQGFSVDALRQCGLFWVREGQSDPRQFHPQFRGRLMIPIRDASQGQVIAFTARVLPCTPEDDPRREAKYVNSPETPLFHKSRMVFNLDRAYKPARDDARGFLMVEGQLDAIRCWTNGFTTAIAPQGTSVTDEQLHLLRRHNDRLQVVLDGDGAGQRAALRVLPMALEAGLEPTFVVLPAGADPDTLLAERGAEALQELVDHASGPMLFACHALLPNPREATARDRAEAMKQLFAILQKVDSEIVRGDYLREASARLGVDYDDARRDFSRLLLTGRTPWRKENQQPTEPNGDARLTSAEADLFCLILQHEELGKRVSEVVEDKWVDAQTLEGRLLGRLLWDLREGACDTVTEFIAGLEDEAEHRTACSLTIRSGDLQVEDPERHAQLLLDRLSKRYRNRRMQELDRQMANQSEHNADMHNLLKEKMELLRSTKNPPRFIFQPPPAQ